MNPNLNLELPLFISRTASIIPYAVSEMSAFGGKLQRTAVTVIELWGRGRDGCQGKACWLIDGLKSGHI